MKKEKILVESPITYRTLKYQKGNVNMSFTVDINNRGQIMDSIDVAEKLIEDLVALEKNTRSKKSKN